MCVRVRERGARTMREGKTVQLQVKTVHESSQHTSTQTVKHPSTHPTHTQPTHNTQHTRHTRNSRPPGPTRNHANQQATQQENRTAQHASKPRQGCSERYLSERTRAGVGGVATAWGGASALAPHLRFGVGVRLLPRGRKQKRPDTSCARPSQRASLNRLFCCRNSP